MDGHGRRPGRFHELRQLRRVAAALVPALAHLHRHRHGNGLHDRLHDPRGPFRVAHEGAAVAVVHDLRHRAAHVDVEKIRAGQLQRKGRSLRHHGRFVPEDLRAADAAVRLTQ